MCTLKESDCLTDMVFVDNNIKVDTMTTTIEVKADNLEGFEY